MKLKVAPWRLIWRFLVVLLIVYVAIFLFLFTMFFNISFDPFSVTPMTWGWQQPLILAILGALGIAAFIPSLTSYYYQIEKHYFLMKKYGREFTYDYNNIEFVDFEESERKKMVIFYTKASKMQYLLSDKEGKILEALKKNCSNLISKEEFRRRHPEEKY